MNPPFWRDNLPVHTFILGNCARNVEKNFIYSALMDIHFPVNWCKYDQEMPQSHTMAP